MYRACESKDQTLKKIRTLHFPEQVTKHEKSDRIALAYLLLQQIHEDLVPESVRHMQDCLSKFVLFLPHIVSGCRWKSPKVVFSAGNPDA